MTNYQKAELAGRIKIALLQAVSAIELQDGPLFDKYIALVARLRCEFGDELDSTG
jgi:hypothetical protein